MKNHKLNRSVKAKYWVICPITKNELGVTVINREVPIEECRECENYISEFLPVSVQCKYDA